jgi:glucose-1-phosphate cytidylyltransferase
MKIVILCGGLGTRLSEETQIKPKPMVEIGGRPILWHIMKIYERHGFTNFMLALGYKGDVIKDYFLNYHARLSDLTVHLKSGSVNYTNPTAEDWVVSLIDTGGNTMTGGRLLRLKPHLQSGGTFMLTYGDGVSDVDLTELLAFHRSHGRLATVTAVRPPVRFGELYNKKKRVTSLKQGRAGLMVGSLYLNPVFSTSYMMIPLCSKENRLSSLPKKGS